ncbi:MAG: MFS transporter [Sediminibacterium sp.]|nr:MFS transporter [Sediminibacterium sp.]MBX9781250.1 MFS transporter [Chitinophagaceae bacterium]
MNSVTHKPRIYRFAVAAFFFIAGISFASWASRIPDISRALNLHEGALGAVLFALPIGSMCSLPLSGWLVAKLGSRKVATISGLIYPTILICLGFSNTVPLLTITLFFFGLFGNMMNISVNTQAVGVEAMYNRSIMATFHGVWSLAGFTGAAVGTILISQGFDPYQHFIGIASVMICMALFSQKYILPYDQYHPDQPIFAKPDANLLKLGLIAFCCMAAEGTMFDWSGIYFQKVVQAPKNLTTLGYAAFMSTMAGGRFLGDRLVTRFGRKNILLGSGSVIATGLLTAVIFPSLVTATAGFLLVGIGVSSVVPVVYSEAGKSTTMSAGVALAAVSSIGFLGFLIGPPLIGFIAEWLGLQWSFALIALLGFGTTLLARITKFS